ncbi:integrase core domain-containing protein [Rhodobacteraceae bacterium D3-12]|nr:integrase core domain-containing protein [Rhodobacteraceae bacterium D3-12]
MRSLVSAAFAAWAAAINSGAMAWSNRSSPVSWILGTPTEAKRSAAITISVATEVKISMPLVTLLRNARMVKDERGRYLPSHASLMSCRAMNNIFIERLWRPLKQEAVYFQELQDGLQAKRVIKDWISFYNIERPHFALDKRSPSDAFFTNEQTQKSA